MNYGYVGVDEVRNLVDGVIEEVEWDELLSKSVWYSDRRYWKEEEGGMVGEFGKDVWCYDGLVYVKCKEGELKEKLKEVLKELVKWYSWE